MGCQRWHSPLCLAPARPKDAVWDYDAQAPGLTAVAQAIEKVPADQLTLTGWPSCLAPNSARGAAQVIELYFRGQTRDLHAACEPCATRQTCPGLVSALLARDGAAGLLDRAHRRPVVRISEVAPGQFSPVQGAVRSVLCRDADGRRTL